MLPTELLYDIASFLARHDIDVLKIVNAVLNGLVVARFEDYPLRPLTLNADANRIRVEEQPIEAGRSVEVSSVGHQYGDVSPLVMLCLQRSFISRLTLEEAFTHSVVYVLTPIKDMLRDTVCMMPLDQGGECVQALGELMFCKEIHFGGSEPSVSDDVLNLVHARFFRLRCWDVCNVLRFNHKMGYVVNELVGWLLSGAERVFTSEREHLGRVQLILERLQNQFVHASTPTSFSLSLTYNLPRNELPLAPSLRENASTGERLEVAVSVDGWKIIVVVRRFIAL